MVIGSKKRWEQKEEVQKLRKEGRSYSEIRSVISLPKSTISNWCRGITLHKDQRARIAGKKADPLPGIKVIQKRHWQKQCNAFHKGSELYIHNRKSTDFISGLMLYWGEGKKQVSAALTNSDQWIIKITTNWFERFFFIPPKNLNCYLNLHSGQDEKEIIEFWSELTKIPKSNFRKSFIKPEGSGYKKNILHKGTITIRVNGEGSTYLLYTILGALSEFIKESTGQNTLPEDWITKPTYA